MSHNTQRLIAAALLILCSPIMLLIALALRLTSVHPVIYRQIRIGLYGEPFTIFKFRTMKDHRPTRLGIWLRRTSLDELPQLVNVLKGDMNIVGPRPEIPRRVQEYRQIYPDYIERHKARPGITGLAQVNGYRGERSCMDARISADLAYVRMNSPLLDFSIMRRTLKAMWHPHA